jgi:hypothetical protein
MDKMTLIKVFDSERKAVNFAADRKGKISVRYDWDSFRNKMVKEFIVKY